ncbi:MAG: response regulator transcription factor [Candidatus Terrybacteria bacterium]|nr:response regulator transcription factor [Candidatus Terrybacteria bacterium]
MLSYSGQSEVKTSSGSKRRVLLIDDHAIFRKGLRQLIEVERDLEVCGETGSALKALTFLKSLKPDMVILDIMLQDGNGLDLTKEIQMRRPGIPVLILSMCDEAIYGQRVLAAGGRGFVMKHQAPDILIKAARVLLSGKIYVSETVFSRYFDRIVGPRRKNTSSSLDALSDRELEVFMLIGAGHKNRHIAEKLYISVSTVETYQSHIEKKLGLRNADELLQYAIHCNENRLKHKS